MNVCKDVQSPQQSLRVEDLDYELPADRIATRPVEPRDSARLLVARRSDDKIEHQTVSNLPVHLNEGDALVFNNSRVVPARLIGQREQTGGRVDGLFLRELTTDTSQLRWLVMLSASSKLRTGIRVRLLDHNRESSDIFLELTERDGSDWIVTVHAGGGTHGVLDLVGHTPIPAYILRARGGGKVDDDLDRRWYQTVYASAERAGSIAAPTAGLHFTTELLSELDRRGIERIDVTLHVGPGTFRPISSERVADHHLEPESFEIAQPSLDRLRDVRQKGGRIIAVGTTSVRVLESLGESTRNEQLCGPIHGMADLMIAPPYSFHSVDGLMTNFHLPRSSLLALVAAMTGLDRLKDMYREAIERGYRFYSYGDAMLILP